MTSEELEKQRLIVEADDIKAIMSTENGRRFIWRLLEYCGIYRDIEGQGQEADRQIGKRRAGLYILGIVSDVEEDLVFEMMKEAKTRKMDEEYVLLKEEEQDKNKEQLNDVDSNEMVNGLL